MRQVLHLRSRLFLCPIALLTSLIISSCGARSDSGLTILNVEFFGDGKPSIRLIDPKEGFRIVHIGDKINGLTILEADKKGVTFLGLQGERIQMSAKQKTDD